MSLVYIRALLIFPSLEIFKHHNISVSSHGPIGIDECLVFGSYGFIKVPYGDYWKFMKKGITTNMLGPQAMEQSRGMTLGRSFSEENNDVKVSELSLELGALTQKIFLQQVLRKVDDHQSSEIMDTLLAAYRDGNADYTITRNHIKALLACFDWETAGGKVNTEEASGRAFLALAILLIVLLFLIT
ncbi:unnamed protein product [Brassica napus]|uniref:(rape) hypothetical protein n=1 Tax=Brassica napus TaxID=3708 RepID=A0A816P0A4_BRANA|nr:unnamed protein product [Brassica napus]